VRSTKAQAVAVLPFATRYGSARSENRIVLVVALHKRTPTNSNDFDQACGIPTQTFLARGPEPSKPELVDEPMAWREAADCGCPACPGRWRQCRIG
jgi:hypothetical protein